MPIPGQRVRAPGTYTVFHWDDGSGQKVIGFANSAQVTSVTPVADPAVIQPLNALRPIEIVTPGAHREGRLVLTLTELYNQAIWQRLAGIANSNDIAAIMQKVAAMNNGISVTKYIRPPAGVGTGPYHETFYECVVAAVRDDESIDVTTLRLDKEIELWYTYSKKFYPGIDSSNAGNQFIT